SSRQPRDLGHGCRRRPARPATDAGRGGGAVGRDRCAGRCGGWRRDRRTALPRRAVSLELPAYLAILATGQHRNRTMVKIRLTRGGAKKRPFYHIIVTDSRSARDGRNIERVGYYNPVAQGAEQRIVLDTARVDHWVGQGAQLTDKVRNLYREVSKAAPAA